jgi:hypothetical protein
MNNSKKDSSKSMRYKEGPKRSFRPNEWYLNQKVHSETDKFFSGSKGGVPNNPENANSFRPISAPINPQESMSGDFVKRKNPYGDAEQITEGEGPTLVRPNQRGSSFDPPPVPVDKPGKVVPPKASKRKGMNTGVSLIESGPQRDVPEPFFTGIKS